MPRATYEALNLGPLPVDRINAALGTELDPGNVRLSAQAHRHMAEDHPADYALCITFLTHGAAVQLPTYVGQAPGHGSNFELIRRIEHPDGKAVLVAIGLEPDADGTYRVRSCYLIARDKVEARRQAGRLKIVPP